MENWLIFNQNSGNSGKTIIPITVINNENPYSREATITFKNNDDLSGQTVIKQTYTIPEVTVEYEREIPSTGAEIEIKIIADDGVRWNFSGLTYSPNFNAEPNWLIGTSIISLKISPYSDDRTYYFYVNDIQYSFFVPYYSDIELSCYEINYSTTLYVYARCKWSINNNIPSWIHFSRTTGSGETEISITLDEPNKLVARKKTIQFIDELGAIAELIILQDSSWGKNDSSYVDLTYHFDTEYTMTLPAYTKSVDGVEKESEEVFTFSRGEHHILVDDIKISGKTITYDYLTDVTVGNFYTNCIPVFAFYSASSLTGLTLGKSMECLGSCSFGSEKVKLSSGTTVYIGIDCSVYPHALNHQYVKNVVINSNQTNYSNLTITSSNGDRWSGYTCSFGRDFSANTLVIGGACDTLFNNTMAINNLSEIYVLSDNLSVKVYAFDEIWEDEDDNRSFEFKPNKSGVVYCDDEAIRSELCSSLGGWIGKPLPENWESNILS